MVSDDSDRVEGVDFTEVKPIFEELSYPIASEELIEQYGDRELKRTNADPITIRELFDYMGEDTFTTPEQLRQMILSQMPRDSEGRTNYSDRGGSHPIETDAAKEAENQTTADLEEGEATDPDVTQR